MRCLVLLVPFALAACATTSRPIAVSDVQRLLAAQREAWNQGDLERFMAGYWHDDALTFVGSSGLTHGFDATLARYQHAYPDGATRGTLTFELVEVRPLGPNHGLAIGRWHLERDQPAEGWFSLVLERRAEGWRIVHDHSS